MSEIGDFLRARYAEARARENGKRRQIPSAFDDHELEVRREGGVDTLLVDGHPYPIDEWREIATEPAPDPDVITDLAAKTAVVDLHDSAGSHRCPTYDQYPGAEQYVDHEPRIRVQPCSTLRVLAQPFAGHQDHKGEEWSP